MGGRDDRSTILAALAAIAGLGVLAWAGLTAILDGLASGLRRDSEGED